MSARAVFPGFSAEAAVYATATIYRTQTGPAALSGSPAAAMSVIGRTGSGGRSCDPHCVCVTPEGCHCCQVMAPQQPQMRESTVSRR
jgi:hypothetical protein